MAARVSQAQLVQTVVAFCLHQKGGKWLQHSQRAAALIYSLSLVLTNFDVHVAAPAAFRWVTTP